MKRRIICLCLALSLIFSLVLTGCTGEDKDITASGEIAETPKPYPVVESEEHEEVAEYVSLDSYITEDWQTEYVNLLDNYRICRSGGHELISCDVNDIYGYWIYDIDHNGIPELIARIGDCEATYRDEVYSVINGKATQVGELPGGHASYYGEPDKGIVLGTAHMGYQCIYQVTLEEDNQLTMTCIFEEDINGDPETDYTPVSEVVDGAYYLTAHCYCINLPIVSAGVTIKTADPVADNEEVRKILFDTVYSNGSVTACQVEHFRNVLPQMDFDTFLEGGNIDEYEKEKDKIVDFDYMDMNCDGQDEALLRSKNNNVVVLSYQSGKVFAYVSNYCYASDIVGFGDGYIEFNTDYYNFRLSLVFFEDQVYEEYTYY